MNQDLAVAAITLAMRQRLQAAVNLASDLGAEVRTDRPDKVAESGSPLVNLYLYHVAIDPFRRNEDLDPTIIRTPQRLGYAIPARQVRTWRTPLKLHYLLSFYGDDRNLVPQRLLAICEAALHRRPVIEAKTIVSVATSHYGAGTGATADIEDVDLTFAAMGPDETFRLWSIFKATYALSIGYVAGTAIVSSDPLSSNVDLVADTALLATASGHGETVS